MSHFIDPEALPVKLLAPGIDIRVAQGEHLMLSFVRLEPGAVVPSSSGRGPSPRVSARAGRR